MDKDCNHYLSTYNISPFFKFDYIFLKKKLGINSNGDQQRKESNGITEYLVASVSFVGSVDQIILQTFEKNRPKGLNVTFP